MEYNQQINADTRGGQSIDVLSLIIAAAMAFQHIPPLTEAGKHLRSSAKAYMAKQFGGAAQLPTSAADCTAKPPQAECAPKL